MSFAGPARLVPPGLLLEDLPPIDVVVISHAHYDHLDTVTLEKMPNKERITAVVPLGLANISKAMAMCVRSIGLTMFGCHLPMVVSN